MAVGATVAFTDDQSHYLRKVMRVAEGSEVKVFDGVSGEWWCRIESRGGRKLAGVVTEQRRGMAAEADLWIVFAPVKGAAMETIVQKATELGASRLLPIVTQRTEARNFKSARLQTIVMEAAEQCERLSCPPLDEPLPLKAFCAAWADEAAGGRALIWCDESADAASAGALPDVLGRLGRGARGAVVVGPEGGFAADERAMLATLPGALPLSLGPRILRADTAAIAALTVFQACVGDWAPPRRD